MPYARAFATAIPSVSGHAYAGSSGDRGFVGRVVATLAQDSPVIQTRTRNVRSSGKTQMPRGDFALSAMHLDGHESLTRFAPGSAGPAVVAAKTPVIARIIAPRAMRPGRDITLGGYRAGTRVARSHGRVSRDRGSGTSFATPR